MGRVEDGLMVNGLRRRARSQAGVRFAIGFHSSRRYGLAEKRKQETFCGGRRRPIGHAVRGLLVRSQIRLRRWYLNYENGPDQSPQKGQRTSTVAYSLGRFRPFLDDARENFFRSSNDRRPGLLQSSGFGFRVAVVVGGGKFSASWTEARWMAGPITVKQCGLKSSWPSLGCTNGDSQRGNQEGWK